MRKTIIVFIVALLVNGYAKAQTQRSINFELWGVYNLVGASFDSRFNETSKFGYKIGIGYGYEQENEKGTFRTAPVGYLRGIPLNHVISAPLNIYYLFGRNRHFFELGAGVTPYLMNYTSYIYQLVGGISVPTAETTKWGLGYYAFLYPAYRYNSERWTGSIGLDIPINTPGAQFTRLIGLYPRLSVGYKF